MDPVDAYISLLSTVLEQPTEIVRGWLNTYYVLRKIAEREVSKEFIVRGCDGILYDLTIPDGEENNHA